MLERSTYLTLQIIQKITAEFEWPENYTFEDELPDGIAMAFKSREIFFSEGFESEMSLQFFPEIDGVEYPLNLGHALKVLMPKDEYEGKTNRLNLSNDMSEPSQNKVENGVRDICKLVQAYMFPYLFEGDDSWIDTYRIKE